LDGGVVRVFGPSEEAPMNTTLPVEIDRPIDQVFHTTLENVSEWSITCVEDELLTETPEVVGSTFRVVTEERGQRMEFMGTVTEYEEPRLSRSYMIGKSFDIDVIYHFEDLGGRTRVTQEAEVTGKGFFKIVFALAGWMFKKSSCDAQNNELESLKRYCEEKIPADAG